MADLPLSVEALRRTVLALPSLPDSSLEKKVTLNYHAFSFFQHRRVIFKITWKVLKQTGNHSSDCSLSAPVVLPQNIPEKANQVVSSPKQNKSSYKGG